MSWHETLDSTSVEAARIGAGGLIEPQWIAARHQTAGRGRLGRKWVSDTGNLYTTALFPITELSADIAAISLSVGLAVRDSVIELSQGRVIPGLKWPNDVRVDEAKLCGILLESGTSNETHERWMSVGIGLNVRTAPEIDAYRTASIIGLAPDIDITPEDGLVVLEGYFRKRLAQILEQGRESVIADWMDATDQKNSQYRAQVGRSHFQGEFAGLDEYGHLRLRSASGEVKTITAGDVELVKEGYSDASRN